MLTKQSCVEFLGQVGDIETTIINNQLIEYRVFLKDSSLLGLATDRVLSQTTKVKQYRHIIRDYFGSNLRRNTVMALYRFMPEGPKPILLMTIASQ